MGVAVLSPHRSQNGSWEQCIRGNIVSLGVESIASYNWRCQIV